MSWARDSIRAPGRQPYCSILTAQLHVKLIPLCVETRYAQGMSTASILPARSRARRRPRVRRLAAWLAACASDPETALRLVDRRRAFFVVVMLALYPIFNFKGFKYNPDLLQLVTLPLVVLTYLNAFEKRSVKSGLWLGLAGALALMTKYWVLTMIGAIGLAALIHPDRLKLLRSPAPWVAIATLVIAMIPHLVWLKEVDFVPLTYAGDVYGLSSRAQSVQLVLGYIGHNLALLAAPVALAAIALAWPSRWAILARQPSALFAQAWSRRENRSVNASQALNVWIIQVVVAIGPPLGGLIFTVYMKTDWGISLFFLTPLALVAIPSLRIQRIALFRIVAIWLVITLATLAASPYIAAEEMAVNPNGAATYGARSQLARELTQAWHTRFNTRWAVVAGTTEVGEPMTFYSPDHPAPFTPGELWSSGLTSLEEARRLGFIGICDTTDGRLTVCEAWMRANGKDAEQLAITTQRFFHGHPGPAISWKIYIVPPAK